MSGGSAAGHGSFLVPAAVFVLFPGHRWTPPMEFWDSKSAWAPVCAGCWERFIGEVVYREGVIERGSRELAT